MEEAISAGYWCHMCSQMVNPVMEVEIKCPFCQSGFVEEMSSSSTARDTQDSDSDFGNDRALSLWAPILLGMMSNPRNRRRNRRFDSEDEGDNDNEDGVEERSGRATDLDGDLEDILRRRRRSSAMILQLLQGIQTGLASELENVETDRDSRDRDRDRDRERERVILINPVGQTIAIQGSYDLNNRPIGSLGDYFIGPGLDLLLQHLAENDPSRYGSPPAQKEAVEALPTVKVEETLQCSVCLDDFDIGTEAKEMPCKHKFHSDCILPWLELHSSCPVCRHQLPADETKIESERARNDSNSESPTTTTAAATANNNNSDVTGGRGEEDERNGSHGRRFSFPWPFSSLFSSSREGNSSSNTSSRSPTASQTDEN